MTTRTEAVINMENFANMMLKIDKVETGKEIFKIITDSPRVWAYTNEIAEKYKVELNYSILNAVGNWESMRDRLIRDCVVTYINYCVSKIKEL